MKERKLIILFFIYLVLEGAFRKWFLPEFSTELYLVKNLLMVSVFLLYLGDKLVRRNHATLHLLNNEFLLLVSWVFFMCGSMAVTGFTMTALIGLNYYLIMLPLVIIIPRILRDTADLEEMMSKYLWLAVAVCLLGILQFNSAPDAAINKYAWTKAQSDIAVLGQKARITGTFSYISPYASYLQFMLLAGLALLIRARSERSRIVLILAVFLLLINIVMTGSRSPFLVSVILAMPFLGRLMDLMKRVRGFWSLALTVVILGSLIYFTSGIFDLLASRNKEAADSELRITSTLLLPVSTLKGLDIIGTGVGTTFLGGLETGKTVEADFAEIYQDRVGIELGIFGYLLVICFKIVFLVHTWIFYRRATDPAVQVWTLVAFSSQLISIWQIPVYSAVAAAFYFGSIGLYIFLRKEQSRLDNLATAST